MKFTALLIGGFLAVAGAANANVLWSQPWDGTSNLYASQNDNVNGNGNFATAYDDFTIGSASNLDGFTFTGGYFNPPNQGPITAFTLTFYADNAGVPGAPIAEGSFSSFNETSLGSVNGFPIYSYSLFFGNFAVSGGTYWASVVPDLAFPPQWGWATSAVGNNAGYQCFLGACGGTGGNFAFDVLGSPAVPEPTTWALMLVGLGGLGASLRLRRKAAIAA